MAATLRQIRSFVTAARHASFTQAARELHLSQPALTVQIRLLEEALGVQLFDRNNRAVALTRTGRELAEKLERLQDEMDAVLGHTKSLSTGGAGVVRIGCVPSYAASELPDAIASYRRTHPNIAIALKDANWSRVVAMVHSEEVDFGIADSGRIGPDLEFHEFIEDRMQVIHAKGHPIASLKRVTLRKLAEFPMVMMDQETSARHYIDAAFAAAGCYPSRACEVMYMATAVAMVRAGLGFTILPSSAIEWRAHKGLAVRAINEASFIRRIGIIRKPGRSLPPQSEQFAQMLLRGRRRA